MSTSFRRMSAWRWLMLASWTIFGTLGCLAVSLAFNWLSFRDHGPEALRQGMISATVLPVILAGPLFFYLTLKLRELAVANHKLNDLASLDGLTGCLNRRAFASRVESDLDAARVARKVGGALLVVDADHFKSINDKFGHDEGDEALRRIAQSIRSVLRSSDALGRLGGEEFGIHLPEANRDIAAEVAERVRVSVAATPFTPAGKRHALSVSVGCVVYDKPAGFRELFSIADERLYAAKHGGRNRVVIDAPALAPTLREVGVLSA
jgi:diguanylate cyclase (GGDEF)-like protein